MPSSNRNRFFFTDRTEEEREISIRVGGRQKKDKQLYIFFLNNNPNDFLINFAINYGNKNLNFFFLKQILALQL